MHSRRCCSPSILVAIQSFMFLCSFGFFTFAYISICHHILTSIIVEQPILSLQYLQFLTEILFHFNRLYNVGLGR